MDDFNALAIAHRVSEIVTLLAQQENLLVLDDWTACFMSPDYTKFVKVLILLKLSSTTEMQEDKIHEEYRTVEVMLSCFQIEANTTNRLSIWCFTLKGIKNIFASVSNHYI